MSASSAEPISGSRLGAESRNAQSQTADVLHINVYDLHGGAAIAANRLHQGLRRIGTNSRMLVEKKAGDDPSVLRSERSRALSASLTRRIRKRWLRGQLARYAGSQPPTADFFSDDRAVDTEALVRALPKAGVYNLHWVARYLDYTRFFSQLSIGQPLVWTLHDMNPFTGGCHYTAGCRRFEAECGFCPALGSRTQRDLSSEIHARKRRQYDRLLPETTRIVTPSQWLAGEARRSSLFRRFDTVVIPNGLDTEVFRPRDRAEARDIFGLPHDITLVMFTGRSLEFHRKGIDLLVAALNELRSENVGLVSVGGGRLQVRLDGRHFPLGSIDDEGRLSFAYSTADILVCPTREDNLPNVVLGSDVLWCPGRRVQCRGNAGHGSAGRDRPSCASGGCRRTRRAQSEHLPRIESCVDSWQARAERLPSKNMDSNSRRSAMRACTRV